MQRIHVSELTTASREFPVVNEGLRSRHCGFADLLPDGRFVRRPGAPAGEWLASAYTPVVASHANTIAGAFESGLYASGLALVRPMLEAILKQVEITNDPDDWERIAKKRYEIRRRSLETLAAKLGLPDLVDAWKGMSPWLNDFVHGGIGTLARNYSSDTGEPRYEASWVWQAMKLSTIMVGCTGALFWTHQEEIGKAERVIEKLEGETWGRIETIRNGMSIVILESEGD